LLANKAETSSKDSFDEKDRIRFINTAPYARKLERDGVTAQRQKAKIGNGSRVSRGVRSKIRVPNGAYALAARAVRAKFKGNSGIKFSLIPGNYLGIGSNYPRQSGAEAVRNAFRGQRIADTILIEGVSPVNFGGGATLSFTGGYTAGLIQVDYKRDLDL
jgi:hypothetical protein